MKSMPDKKYFIDTNVWLYAFVSSGDQQKSATAKRLIETSRIVISSQVINELCVNLIKKTQLPETDIAGIITSLYTRYETLESDQELLLSASGLRRNYTFSYWDSLIVAAALRSDAKRLYTEDMHDGLVVEKSLTIVNPFKCQ
jgi:predicted nucleic acid-binding protein